jgi:hypothetical protein
MIAGLLKQVTTRSALAHKQAFAFSSKLLVQAQYVRN